MRRPEPSRGQVTLLGRLAVLLVLAAGFFTMHGFMAVSASAEAHAGHGVRAVQRDVPLGQPTSTPMGTHADTAAEPTVGIPASPRPADHHDVVAGCVVALVGIAALALTALWSRRRGPAPTRWLLPAPAHVGSWLGDRLPTLLPPRALSCVIQV